MEMSFFWYTKWSKHQTPPLPAIACQTRELCAGGSSTQCSSCGKQVNDGATVQADWWQPQQRFLPPSKGNDWKPLCAEMIRMGSALEHKIRSWSLLHLFGFFLNRNRLLQKERQMLPYKDRPHTPVLRFPHDILVRSQITHQSWRE